MFMLLSFFSIILGISLLFAALILGLDISEQLAAAGSIGAMACVLH